MTAATGSKRRRPALFVDPDGTALLARIAHRVRAGADLTGLRRPKAALAHAKRYTWFPPETFTAVPRLDLLTAEQHQAIQAPVRDPLHG